MNLDDFEKKLRQQKLRQVPGTWRETILGRAAKEQTSAVKSIPALLQGLLTTWRELIQPCRYAWSGIGAVWMILWMVNAHTELADSPKERSRPTVAVVERIRSFEERRRDLVELTGPLELSPAAVSVQNANPKPRSERTLVIRHC